MMLKAQRIIFLLVFFLFVNINNAMADEASTNVCWKNPTFIQKVNKDKMLLVWDVFIKKIPNDGSVDLSNILPANFPGNNSVDSANAIPNNLLAVYIADINNDTKPENILVFSGHGSMGINQVVAMQQQGNKIIYFGDIPKPENSGDGPWYFSRYFDVHNQDQFLTQLCGKTYMVFSSANRYRDAYLWSDGATQNACDSDWLRYERYSFDKLYSQGLYDDAYAQMKFITDKCRDIRRDPQLYLWMLNDLAVSAFKSGSNSACLDATLAIDADPAFSTASQRFKNAVAFNENLCREKSQQPTKLDPPWRKDEFSWLLAKDITKTKDYPDRIKKLFSQIIPSVSSNVLSLGDESLFVTISDVINNGAMYPTIRNNRYVWFWGWVPHDAGLVSFVWIDTYAGTSLVGFVIDSAVLDITSRNYHAQDIPQEAKNDIMSNLPKMHNVQYSTHDTKEAISSIHFYDIETKQNIALSPDWLGKH